MEIQSFQNIEEEKKDDDVQKGVIRKSTEVHKDISKDIKVVRTKRSVKLK